MVLGLIYLISCFERDGGQKSLSFERIASKTSKKVLKKFLTNENESGIINRPLIRS